MFQQVGPGEILNAEVNGYIYYPSHVMHQGQVPTSQFSRNKSRRCYAVVSFLPCGPAVISEKNDIKAAYKDHILKHVGLLRNPLFGLSRGADYLEEWVEGLLAPCPLLDVSGFPG